VALETLPVEDDVREEDHEMGLRHTHLLPALAAAVGVVGAAATYGFTTSIGFGWRRGTTLLLATPTDATNDWTNESAKAGSVSTHDASGVAHPVAAAWSALELAGP
jgi:hypothetical protein